MTNAVRGEVKLSVPDKGDFTLCLSLGALAEIETELGIDDVSQIGEKLKKPKAEIVAKLVCCMVHGGGHEEVTAADILKWRVGLPILMQKVKEAMSATDIDDGAEAPPEGNA
jgi:Phage tail tube protein, GTA-gp10